MNQLASAIAKTIINGFERHLYLFNEITRSAKQRFEDAEWHDVQEASKQRTDYYDLRIKETLATIEQDFAITELDETLWQAIKQEYVEQLLYHDKSDLAESFYNSIFCHLFERKYYHNAFIFVESSQACLENLRNKVMYTRYEPDEHGLFDTIATILQKPNFSIPFQDLTRDINILIERFFHQADKTRYPVDQLKFDILDPVFYRQ